jgi:hypothetical protein
MLNAPTQARALVASKIESTTLLDVAQQVLKLGIGRGFFDHTSCIRLHGDARRTPVLALPADRVHVIG